MQQGVFEGEMGYDGQHASAITSLPARPQSGVLLHRGNVVTFDQNSVVTKIIWANARASLLQDDFTFGGHTL